MRAGWLWGPLSAAETDHAVTTARTSRVELKQLGIFIACNSIVEDSVQGESAGGPQTSRTAISEGKDGGMSAVSLREQRGGHLRLAQKGLFVHRTRRPGFRRSISPPNDCHNVLEEIQKNNPVVSIVVSVETAPTEDCCCGFRRNELYYDVLNDLPKLSDADRAVWDLARSG